MSIADKHANFKDVAGINDIMNWRAFRIAKRADELRQGGMTESGIVKELSITVMELQSCRERVSEMHPAKKTGFEKRYEAWRKRAEA